MDEEIYKIGESWRFSVDKSGRIFYYEGKIISITSNIILIFDKVLQTQVVIYQNTITGAEKKAVVGGKDG